jgi:hypothetical protein
MGGKNIMVRVERILSQEPNDIEWDDILEFMFNFIMRRI